MSSKYEAIVDRIVDLVNDVASVGSVYAYQRFTADWSKYLALFQQTNQVRGWWVTLAEQQPISTEYLAFDSVKRTYNVDVVGVMAVKDSASTERTFLALAESVMDALEGKSASVTGVVSGKIGPVSLRTYQYRQFGSVMCHYCEISVEIDVEVDL
jgi:hypothetical protein